MGRLVDQTGIDQMWDAYWVRRESAPGGSATLDLRDALVDRYAPLVSFVVGRMQVALPAVLDRGDLIQYGSIGLIQAIERYQRRPDADFEAFALTRIRGAIVDELRHLDFLPRSLRRRAKELEKVVQQQMQSLGRAPTEEETAAAIGESVEIYRETLQNLSYGVCHSLDVLSAGAQGDQEVSLLELVADPEAPAPDRAALEREVAVTIGQVVRRLPERSQQILALYYDEGLTMKEIAAVLEVSESRVSQLHTHAMAQLRAGLAEERATAVAA